MELFSICTAAGFMSLALAAWLTTIIAVLLKR